jgi:hypothetical protein
MALVLKERPPHAREGSVTVIDGGIALRHNPWLSECGVYVAFAREELTPLPECLICPACGEAAPLVGFVRAAVERVLAGVEAESDD